MLCAFTHQSCFQKHIKPKSRCRFPQDPAWELGLFQRQMKGGSTSRYQKGFRTTDLTNPCYTCGWGRRPWPESVTSWWPHQPHGVQGPHMLDGNPASGQLAAVGSETSSGWPRAPGPGTLYPAVLELRMTVDQTLHVNQHPQILILCIFPKHIL